MRLSKYFDKGFIKNIALKPIFYIPLVLTSLVCYGFYITNVTINIDTLALDLYYETSPIKFEIFRWAEYYIYNILSTNHFVPYWNQIIGTILLLFSSVVLCNLFFELTRCEKPFFYTVLSCLFISYPLYTEACVYDELILLIPFEYLLIFSVSLIILKENKMPTIRYLLLGFLMTLVSAGYESIIFTYVSLVLIILFLNCTNKKYDKFVDSIVDGMRYAIPLIISLIVRYVIGYFIIYINDYSKLNTLSERFSFINIIKQIFRQYVYNGLFYFPIAILVISIMIFTIFAISDYLYNDRKSIIYYFAIIGSLFILAFVYGTIMPYRTAQSTQLFVAFSFFYVLIKIDDRVIKCIAILLSIIIIYKQSIYTNNILCLNNQRSNNEAMVIQNIGNKLINEYDIEKPVIFCGENDLGKEINKQIYADSNNTSSLIKKFINKENKEFSYRIVDTSVSSTLNWAIRAFNGQDMMKKMFNYYGYDITTSDVYFDVDINKEYEKIAISNGMKSFEIKDLGDYILVYLGEIKSN